MTKTSTENGLKSCFQVDVLLAWGWKSPGGYRTI